jgi:uncharacterized protein
MSDSAHPKPLPIVTDVNRPYWEGCRQGKLLLQHCQQCQQYQFYPRLYCMQCGSDKLQWAEASGRGRLSSYTIIHRNKTPEFVQDVPYNVAIIQLDEGPRMMANIVGSDNSQLGVDLPVTVVFDPVTDEISVPRFKLT